MTDAEWGLLQDVLFFQRHPGWSWADYQNAPEELLAAMKLFDSATVRRE
jgi:hypothetical protein